jgi:hypothetical protein
VNKFTTSQHLPADVKEADIDDIGLALLREQARAKGLSVTGTAKRIYDEYIVGVVAPGLDGKSSLTHVPIGSPLAEGKTTPDARMVGWEVAVKPFTREAKDPIKGAAKEGDPLSRAVLPPVVTENGGLVRFEHNLGGEVTVSAYDVKGGPVAIEFAVEVNQNEQQVQVTPGAVRLQAIRDDAEQGANA